jgi:hypothetical protein
MLQPLAHAAYAVDCARTGAVCSEVGQSHVQHPLGPETFPLPVVNFPDCSQVDCTTLLINNSVVMLDTVSLYTAGGAAGAQVVAIGCGAVGLLPCTVAAEGAAATLGTVSTATSIVGTALTAVQVARAQATAVDLAVSLTSTLLGAKGKEYVVNAGASGAAAELYAVAISFGASYLQYQYDTK